MESGYGMDYHKQDLIGRFAQHKVAANLLMLVMLLAGVIALGKLNTQFLPSFQSEFVVIRVIWPGAAAEDVSRSVITPLEQALRDLDYVKQMTSTAYQGSGVIVLEYEPDSDMGLALDQVKQSVDTVRNLPSDAEEPVIYKWALYEDIATLVLSSGASREELRALAYKFERELLDAGVAKVEFVGLPEEEIAIQVSAEQISALQQSLPQLAQKIAAFSRDIPAGTTGRADLARELRAVEQKRTVQEFNDLAILTTSDGQSLRLGDFAEVERRPKQQQVEVYYQGQPAVLLRVRRTQTSDTLEAAGIVNDWLEKTRATLPPSLQLHAFNETYVLIEDRINLLIKNGLSGLILVIAILFIFLNGRVAFWVTVGIPISFMGTLAVLYLLGGSINMVSMFALIMALGIIVDDAIVVGEDALTHFTHGENPLRAAEGGARRMFVPVMSSSLTTIAAFLPLMLISGIFGAITATIPLVIICVIIASLVECFLILPGHLNHSFRKSTNRMADSALRRKLDDRFNYFRDQIFRPLSEKAIQNRAVVLMSAACLFAIAISLIKYGHIKSDFFPQPENHVVLANVKFVSGTPPEQVKAFAMEMERALWAASDELKTEQALVVYAIPRINEASFDGGQNFSRGEHYASMHVELLQPDAREVRNPEFIAAWQRHMRLPDGIEQLSISSPRGGPPGQDIDIFLSGQSPKVLKEAAKELKTQLSTYEGVYDIQDDLPFGKHQYLYQLTPTGKALGLTVNDIGSQLRAAFDGQIVQVFYDEHDEVEVRLTLPDQERDHARTLDNFPIVTPAGEIAQLRNVVELRDRQGLELVRHTDGKLGLHVTASVNAAINNANAVLAELRQEFLPNLSKEYGLKIEFKGRAEEQASSQADMVLGAQIAFILIYLILAWVFGSYLWPLAVMLAIPLGISGAIYGHWLLGLDLTLLSWFGFFGLAGIVINDSIILITFYRHLCEQGATDAKAAIVEATCARLRAVMLTSLTTIAGLLPLLFETSLQAQFLIPMAVSISFGLAYGTLLILFVIPALVTLLEEWKVTLAESFQHLRGWWKAWRAKA